MREYRYWLLDVFTETALTGNPLAVFLDGTGLSDGEMQALARETNLSETTFCLPGEGGPGARVRIFTTDEELPFAGHPTLGTATALRLSSLALRDAPEVMLRLNVGPVRVRFEGTSPSGLPFGQVVRGEMEQPLPRFGRQHDPAAVAAALGLPREALDGSKPIQTVSTGLPFVVVPLVSVAALAELRISRNAAEEYLRGTDGKFFYAIASGASALQWRARMQFYVGEDPATGSAAGCATAYLVRHGFAPSDTSLLIEQGVEIGRRSVLHTRAALHGEGDGPGWGADSFVRVGGSTIPVAEGRFFLP